ncbi:AMP-dependent synthetase/ligase [Nocardia bovistercoris]|uniref:Acyl-CoA synthetase n=1 Tax=Nocardia bovistercoris TaxID=2785916 RepID=A0A931MYR1_9NOCA|nr:long-chain fatty acid--CoA ligase [Nocardia bovistercoris]MBH0775310.1 long-chain fatty acid--CoA ligase [Nocardia bovistercoris]
MPQRRDPFVSFRHSSGILARTLPEAFQATAAQRPDATAVRSIDTGREYTWREYAATVEHIAAGLAALSVTRGDTVGLLLTNRPEFHFVDTAALHLGAVPFSLYNTLPAEQLGYICANAANRVLVTEQRFLPVVRRSGLRLAHIVCVDAREPGTLTLDRLMTLRPRDFDLDTVSTRVHPEDLATITYTSGTTGRPKGVELTHSNILAQLVGLGEHLPADHTDRIISYLPAAHIADRITAHYAALTRGIQVATLADPHRMAEALTTIHPTVVFGVPRVWQKTQAAVTTAVADAPGVTAGLARWALRVADQRATAEIAGGRATFGLRLRHRVADRIALSAIRAGTGLDMVRFAASGAAPIPVDTLRFFHGLGIPLTEVWGLSEAAGVSTTTTNPDPALGSVGRALRGTDIRLATDGEILVRGPMVMRGYRGEPNRTASVFLGGGWLRTGDLGALDSDGNLHIIGRKSEMIITDAGKNVAPNVIENAVKAVSFLVGQVMAIGDARPYLTALVTLDALAIAADAAAKGVVAADLADLAARPRIRELVTEAVIRANATVSRPEQIKRFVILDHTWEPGSAELTPKMTLRRTIIAQRYAELIEALYAPRPGPGIIEVHGSRRTPAIG